MNKYTLNKETGKYICPFCNKEFSKNGIGTHIWRSHSEEGLIFDKIDFEVDGEQHYKDQKIIESDKKRTEYLKKNGWKIIRIRWSKWQKMSRTSKENLF